MFDGLDKQLIDDFIKKIIENNLANKKVSFEYDLTDYDNKRLIGTTYDCPRGNAASEKWSDRVLSDTFTLVDIITYKINANSNKIGHLMFQKYESKKIFGEDISTVNINNSISDFYSVDEYYSGIGVDVKNRHKAKSFFDDKRDHLARVILKKI